MSGIFFSGPPYDILDAWRNRRVDIVASPEILDEYWRVSRRLSKQYPRVNAEPLLTLIATRALVVVMTPRAFCQTHLGQ
jgi:predicted nucleic acid-binding protein